MGKPPDLREEQLKLWRLNRVAANERNALAVSVAAFLGEPIDGKSGAGPDLERRQRIVDAAVAGTLAQRLKKRRR